jgi:hypothetical protein
MWRSHSLTPLSTLHTPLYELFFFFTRDNFKVKILSELKIWVAIAIVTMRKAS